MNDPAPETNMVDEAIPEAPVEAEAEAPVDIAEVAKHIKANFDFNVDVRPTIFHFKSTKDAATGISTKRDSVELALPYPSVQGIVDILEGEDNAKELELLREAVDSVITQHARAMLSDNESINAANLDVDKLSWTFIANMPKPERTGGGIPKETWEGFADDYREVMPVATGKTDEQVAVAAKLLLNKFAAVKTNLPVLEMLQGQLAIYAETSEDINTFLPCVEFLLDKADKLINVSPEELLASL